MLGGRRFFLQGQVTDADDLIRVAYDLASFWKVDPEVVLDRPVSIIAEQYDHAMRINRQSVPDTE
ncbi:hypothetical protein AB4Z48_17680 [Cupriavidus sp. 2TAF22]|uniref:hypothetical protein n=1 Tax=unclassified Cupriavidus TaxID=2640874 RepID=UPI003F92DD12